MKDLHSFIKIKYCVARLLSVPTIAEAGGSKTVGLDIHIVLMSSQFNEEDKWGNRTGRRS